jgi:zinc/manganese transport system substrate-binding protein
MISRRLALAGLLAAAAIAPLGGAFAQEKLKVVASFSILGDLVRQVGGDRVDLAVLVGPDGDAHVFQPSPSDAKQVAGAKLVVVNGLGFEGWMERLVKASGYAGPVATATTGITPREMEEDEEGHAEEKGHGPDAVKHEEHGHHGIDPHAWQSVANAKIYVTNIRDALIAADPAGKEAYEKNAAAYSATLDGVEADVKAAVAALPKGARKLITSHDAFGYFGAAYGIEFLAPQGISSESEASAKDVANLIRQIKKEKVRAVFVENITDPRLIRRIAQESKAKVGGTLYSDALSGPDGPAATYVDMMRHNIETLSAGLTS